MGPRNEAGTSLCNWNRRKTLTPPQPPRAKEGGNGILMRWGNNFNTGLFFFAMETKLRNYSTHHRMILHTIPATFILAQYAESHVVVKQEIKKLSWFHVFLCNLWRPWFPTLLKLVLRKRFWPHNLPEQVTDGAKGNSPFTLTRP